MPMSKVKNDPVIGLGISDIHLSLKPPIARSEEPCWLKAQGRVWRQIKKLQLKYNCPIVCAGDIFDRWNSSPELINWALDNLPRFYAIPGNHDLPSHRNELENRSAYGSLVRAGKVVEIPKEGCGAGEMLLCGFPFGSEVSAPQKASLCVTVAVIHEYMWIPGAGFPGAAVSHQLSKKDKRFSGFNVVLVGDNHLPWELKLRGGTTVVNCGTVIRRKSSEVDYKPRITLIHRSGNVSSKFLNTKKDVITMLEPNPNRYEGIEKFVTELHCLEQSELSFRDAVHSAVKKLDPNVRDIILEAMEEKGGKP